MNPGIPKSARDALASQTPAEQHPSADLLNGYAELSLSAAEKEQVTQHLALCQDCREVVFLASAAAEEPSPSAVAEAGPAWRGWKWLVPATVVLALAASVLMGRRDMFSPAAPVGTPAANEQAAAPAAQPAAPQAEPESNRSQLHLDANAAVAAKPSSREPMRAPLNHGKKAPLQDQVAAAPGVVPPTQPDHREAVAVLANPAKTNPTTWDIVSRPADSPSGAASGGAVSSPLQTAVAQQPPTAHSLGAFSSRSLTGLNKAASPAALVGTNKAAISPRAFWRVAADGHLERWQTGQAWTRVLGDQAVSFRAVAVVGNDVWAGGNNGALFHSVDGGDHWSPVALTADGHPEGSAVTTIRFSTVTDGSVSTEAGTTWTTTDHGQTWSKQ